MKTSKDIIRDFAEIDEEDSIFSGLQNKTHTELCEIIENMAQAIFDEQPDE